MSLTVQGLHKQLSKLIADGHGRKPVCIDKRAFTHPCEEDGTVILEVTSATGPTWIANADDDGGTKFNHDGTESGRYTIILKGHGE